MITDIFEIEKEIKQKIGNYLINSIIPCYMENYELGENFTKDDKLFINNKYVNNYAFWTSSTDKSRIVYFETGLIRYKITDHEDYQSIVQLNADYNGQEKILLSYWKQNKEFDIVNINNMQIYTEVLPFFIDYFEEKICDANGIR